MPLQNSNVLWRDLAGEHNSKANAVLSFPSDFGYERPAVEGTVFLRTSFGIYKWAQDGRKGRMEKLWKALARSEGYLSLIKWALPIFSCWAISPALESSDTR